MVLPLIYIYLKNKGSDLIICIFVNSRLTRYNQSQNEEETFLFDVCEKVFTCTLYLTTQSETVTVY